jgi:hypothetical protein
MRIQCTFSLAAIATCACGNGSTGTTTLRDAGELSLFDSSRASDSATPGADSAPWPADATTDAPGSGSDASSAGGDSSLTDSPLPIAPTVSSWLGTNIAADLSRIDVTYQLNPFDTAATQLDANGYPVAGASGKSSTDIGFVLPSGTYKISYVGSGSLAISGIGSLGGAWQSVAGEERNTVQITGTPGAFGNFLTLTIANGPGQSVQQIRLLYPGFDYGTTETFLPQFLALLAPFRAMRFMDWEATNGSKLANFADRPAGARFGKSPNGEPYEHLVELVNETGKDCWVTVPELATDAFIAQFAAFLASNLDFGRIQTARARAGLAAPFQLIVEDSNETWNQGFTAYGTYLAAAKATTARYNGTYAGAYGPAWMTSSADLMRVGQYHADRLVKIATAFRSAFGSNASAVAPVLSGWALGPGYSDVGLQFIQTNYGDPKQFVTYVAQAPYFATPDDTTTGALDTLFGAIGANIAGMDATFKDFANLGRQYGLSIVAYEGGQSLTGTTNQPIKHLAQHDARMYAAYKMYLSLWKQDFGSSLFMHFSLAGTPGLPETIYQYGFWGSILGVLEDPSKCGSNLPTLTGTEAIPSVVHHCPKYRALSEYVPQ